MSQLQGLYPRLEDALENTIQDAQLDHITSELFQRLKKRLIIAGTLLDDYRVLHDAYRWQLIDSVLRDDKTSAQKAPNNLNLRSKTKGKGSVTTDLRRMMSSDFSVDQQHIEMAEVIASVTSDVQFLRSLEEMTALEPRLQHTGTDAIALAQDHFCDVISRLAKTLARKAEFIQQEDLRKRIQQKAQRQEEEYLKILRAKLIYEVNGASQLQSSM